MPAGSLQDPRGSSTTLCLSCTPGAGCLRCDSSWPATWMHEPMQVWTVEGEGHLTEALTSEYELGANRVCPSGDHDRRSAKVAWAILPKGALTASTACQSAVRLHVHVHCSCLCHVSTLAAGRHACNLALATAEQLQEPCQARGFLGQSQLLPRLSVQGS